MPGEWELAVEGVIEHGIKAPIQLLLGHGFYSGALILTYSGMDTMAYLNMPEAKTDVMRSDFIAWAEKYIVVQNARGLTGADLYGARCSVLHGGAQSRFTREGRGRPIGYSSSQSQCTTQGTEQFISISVPELAAAFFVGVDRFLADVLEDEVKARTVYKRLEELRQSSADF